MTCRLLLALWLVGWLAGSGLAQAGPADARWVAGRVLVDADADGRADWPRVGVAEVKLSNGRDVVSTDREGRYRIALREGDTLFLIKPAGWQASQRPDGLPDTWEHERRTGSRALRYGGMARGRAKGRFVLRPAGQPRWPLEVRVFGDPQPKSAEDVGFFARDIVEPLLARPAQVGISLGDIVDDDLSLYPRMIDVTARLQTPWLHVAGNHDLDFDATSDRASLDTFRQHFGPDSFAWEEPGVAIVGLDNVIYDPATRRYQGGLRGDQFAFLQAYLPTVPADSLLVLAVHIPLFRGFDTEHRRRLFSLLAPFGRVLVLSSHIHVQQHVFYGAEQDWPGAVPLHEYNVGAACGGFWSGQPDAEGIPDARMADGTPNGFATLLVEETGSYALRWTVARDSADPAMHLHAPKVLRRGAWPGVPLVANVYMADADSRVEARVGDGAWQPMRRVEVSDPVVLATNLADDAATRLRSFDRLVQAVPSTHVYQFNLPTNLPAGEHLIEVRVFDRWRGELRASTSYRLAEWP